MPNYCGNVVKIKRLALLAAGSMSLHSITVKVYYIVAGNKLYSIYPLNVISKIKLFQKFKKTNPVKLVKFKIKFISFLRFN